MEGKKSIRNTLSLNSNTQCLQSALLKMKIWLELSARDKRKLSGFSVVCAYVCVRVCVSAPLHRSLWRLSDDFGKLLVLLLSAQTPHRVLM